MKRSLQEILYRVRIGEVAGATDVEVKNIRFDSRKVGTGDLFVAVKGTEMDGHQFIPKVVEQGAVAVVCEDLPEDRADHVTYVKVRDAREALGHIASNYYGKPSSEIQLVGVTGTNGKTTTVTLLYELFRSLGYKVGLLSTVVNRIDTREALATLTTPDPVMINALLREMVDTGCAYCFMEVSSHALVQKRVTGLSFAGGVFTNITREHLDYHKDFEEYIRAKKILFDELPSGAFALVNNDDRNGKVMLQNTRAKQWSFGLKTAADFKAKILENRFSGLHLSIVGKDLHSSLIGSFNAYNLLAVYGVAVLLEEEEMEVLTHISSLKTVQGRFEYFKTENDVTAVVDFAHSPDALENVLKTIQEIRSGNEKVITVVGCGGDRDKQKRPEMARIACEYSDRVVLTSDNPRSEDPQVIIEEMKKGLDPTLAKKAFAIPDRREGIRMACSLAEDHDIVLVAGKGHEKYQEIKGERLPFDDMEVLRETFNALSSDQT